jgi:cyclic lactone autoinducer peptide
VEGGNGMRKLVAVVADKALTKLARGLANTGCFFWCHAQETPDELL